MPDQSAATTFRCSGSGYGAGAPVMVGQEWGSPVVSTLQTSRYAQRSGDAASPGGKLVVAVREMRASPTSAKPTRDADPTGALGRTSAMALPRRGPGAPSHR
jgi:hypothetical protein